MDLANQQLMYLSSFPGTFEPQQQRVSHDDVIKWKHFPRYWPFVWGIHRSRWIPHTKASDAELWCFSLLCVWINGWVNSREAGDLRRHRGHYDVIVMILSTQYHSRCGPDKSAANVSIKFSWKYSSLSSKGFHNPHSYSVGRCDFKFPGAETGVFIREN